MRNLVAYNRVVSLSAQFILLSIEQVNLLSPTTHEIPSVLSHEFALMVSICDKPSHLGAGVGLSANAVWSCQLPAADPYLDELQSECYATLSVIMIIVSIGILLFLLSNRFLCLKATNHNFSYRCRITSIWGPTLIAAEKTTQATHECWKQSETQPSCLTKKYIMHLIYLRGKMLVAIHFQYLETYRYRWYLDFDQVQTALQVIDVPFPLECDKS